jgi:hypothetical protein
MSMLVPVGAKQSEDRQLIEKNLLLQMYLIMYFSYKRETWTVAATLCQAK